MRNSNLDRFIPPQLSEEPRALCANCGAEGQAPEMLYDERAEQYVCDRGCFENWADDHFDIVCEYYYRHNVGY